jgi:peptidoglycan/LPS O-acetylase OafA/YrhL
MTRNNNFNLLRIVAAIAVLISHAYPLALGPATIEPLENLLGLSLGTLAVLTFFAISGYFISQSFDRRSDLVEFASARVLRIYPALVVVLLLTVFVVGPFFTDLSLGSYFSNPQTILYIPRNLRLWSMQYDLPGVFSANRYQAINGSLWTLLYEVACYASAVIFGWLSSVLSRRMLAAAFVAYFALYALAFPVLPAIGHEHLLRHNIHLLSFPFFLGMALYHLRRMVPLRFSILTFLLGAAAASHNQPWFHEAFVLAWCYGIFYLGFAQWKRFLTYNRVGDYSYGTYIYAWPIAQIVVASLKDCGPVLLISISLPLTLVLAALSWHLVEVKALSQKKAAAAWMRRSISRSAIPRSAGNANDPC